MTPHQRVFPTARQLTHDLGGSWQESKAAGTARCPAHDDKEPSLDIAARDAKTVFVCRAGCGQRAVLAALQARGVWPDKVVRLHEPAPARPRTAIERTYGYQNADGVEVFEVVRFRPKSFRQRHKDSTGTWVWKLPDAGRGLYRLPQVLKAIANGSPIVCVEGEKDVQNLAALGIPATTNAGGANKWTAAHAEHLRGADVVIVADNDHAGRAHANGVVKTLRDVATRLRVLELPDLPQKGDLSDWIAAGGTAEHFWQLVETAPELAPGVMPFPGARQAKPEKAARSKPVKDEPADAVPAHWTVEPWPETVNGAALLDGIAAAIERYMVLPAHAAEAIALWIAHAWAHNAFDISPLLTVTSPTKQCGKTTLLTILSWLTPRSVLASNISSAAVFRFIEDKHRRSCSTRPTATSGTTRRCVACSTAGTRVRPRR